MTVKQLTVEEFKAHCAEELEQVTGGDVSLQLTDHGRVVAVVDPAPSLGSGTIADVMGKGCGVEYAPDFDPDAPACHPEPPPLSQLMGSLRGQMSIEEIKSFDEPTFAPEDWEEHPVHRNEE